MRSQKQKAAPQAKKPEMKKPMEHKYEGRGTRARLNTIAEKMVFNTKLSK